MAPPQREEYGSGQKSDQQQTVMIAADTNIIHEGCIIKPPIF